MSVPRPRLACWTCVSPWRLRATPISATSSAISSTIPDTEASRRGYDVWKEYVESFGFGRKLGSDFLDEGNGYVPDRSLLRPPVPGFVELADGAVALDRAGCAGLHAVAAGQPGGHRRQPRLLLHPAHRQERSRGGIRSTARFLRDAIIRKSIRNISNRSSRACGGACNVGRNLDAGPARRVWTSAARPVRPRTRAARDHSTFLSFAPKDNPKHRHFGLCRERRVRRLGRSAHRQPARRVLPDGHDPHGPGCWRYVKRHEHLLSRPMTNNRHNGIFYGRRSLDSPALRADRRWRAWISITSASYDEECGRRLLLLALLHETADVDRHGVGHGGRRAAARRAVLPHVRLPGLSRRASRCWWPRCCSAARSTARRRGSSSGRSACSRWSSPRSLRRWRWPA